MCTTCWNCKILFSRYEFQLICKSFSPGFCKRMSYTRKRHIHEKLMLGKYFSTLSRLCFLFSMKIHANPKLVGTKNNTMYNKVVVLTCFCCVLCKKCAGNYFPTFTTTLDDTLLLCVVCKQGQKWHSGWDTNPIYTLSAQVKRTMFYIEVNCRWVMTAITIVESIAKKET